MTFPFQAIRKSFIDPTMIMTSRLEIMTTAIIPR